MRVADHGLCSRDGRIGHEATEAQAHSGLHAADGLQSSSQRGVQMIRHDIACAQCGRPVPDDRDELERWKSGNLLLAGELEDDVAIEMLVCPECVRVESAGDYEAGEGD